MNAKAAKDIQHRYKPFIETLVRYSNKARKNEYKSVLTENFFARIGDSLQVIYKTPYVYKSGFIYIVLNEKSGERFTCDEHDISITTVLNSDFNFDDILNEGFTLE